MVNRHLSNWSAMGSSRFEFENDLDKRQAEREKVYEEFKKRIIDDYKNALLEFSKKSNTVKIDNLMKDGLRILIREFAE